MGVAGFFVNLTNYLVKCIVPVVLAPVALLEQPDAVRVALSPIRRRLLQRLRTPASATELAGEMNLARQKVNYHLRALEHAGLVALVETRQKRGCTERVVVASARGFVVDPALVGGRDAPVRAAAQDRFAAERLVATASHLVRDVTRMQVKAESQRKRLLTFTIETEVGFAEPADVARFSQALADAVARLAVRFESKGAERRYRVVIGGHPAPKSSRPTGGAAS
jgi:DNA-binding transcriptional ArsR family regulator